MFIVDTLGEYVNFCLPYLVWPEDLESWMRPRPEMGSLDRIPLNTAPEVRLEFKGDISKLAHYYSGVSAGLCLVCERMNAFMRARDPDAFDARPLTLANHNTSSIERFWLLLPLRTLDAADIKKSDITIDRRPLFEGQQKVAPRVSYNGFVLREDIPSDAQFFMDRFHHSMIWRAEAFKAAIDAGLYGFYGMSKGRLNVGEEVRVPGPYAER
jgi:hypothetical protein